MSYIWTVLLIHFRNRNEQKWKPRMKTIDLWLWRPLRACVRSPPLFLRQVWLRPALSSCRRVCICALLGRLWSVDTAGRVTPLHALHINTQTHRNPAWCVSWFRPDDEILRVWFLTLCFCKTFFCCFSFFFFTKVRKWCRLYPTQTQIIKKAADWEGRDLPRSTPLLPWLNLTCFCIPTTGTFWLPNTWRMM